MDPMDKCIVGKPTEDQLHLTRTVLDWLAEYAMKTDPHAVSFINSCHTVSAEMPDTPENLEDN